MLFEIIKKNRLIHWMYASFFRKKHDLIWYKQYLKVRKEEDIIKTEPSLPKGKKLLLIPHSDDEWVGSSRVILDRDVILVDTDMQGGDTDKIHLLRKQELKSTSDTYGIRLITVSKKSSIESIILEHKPEYIMLPFCMDWHPEHIKVMEMVLEKIDDFDFLKGIIQYQVSIPILPRFITHSLKMSRKQHKEKWKYFEKCYVSQKCIPFRRFVYLERVNGYLCSSFAAEVFRVTDAKTWKMEYEKYKLDGNEISIVAKKAGNINKIRTMLAEICKKK